MNTVNGIHHVTAISSDAQKNVDFYTNVLGLRLVKRTVNFDDPQTYHLYYGDESGAPGTILTFFPWGTLGYKGRKGTSQATCFSFSIPAESLQYWRQRLASLNIHVSEPLKRFGEDVLIMFDDDEFMIELVASNAEKRPGWENGDISGEHAIRGFHGVTLAEKQLAPSAAFLQSALGFEKVAEEENRHRFQTGGGGIGTYVDVLVQPDVQRGVMGTGIIHHVAFRVSGDAEQIDLRDKLFTAGYGVTDVADRQYFKSIYFREPGGFLFEVATDAPGFAVDESPEELGTTLKLPPWLEKQRRAIEESLPPIQVRTLTGAKA